MYLVIIKFKSFEYCNKQKEETQVYKNKIFSTEDFIRMKMF